MQKIYSALQLHELHRLALEQMGLTRSDLYERGAMAFVQALGQLYRSAPKPYIFAGPHTCGAYTLAIARLLWEAGYQPEVYIFHSQGRLMPDVVEQQQRLIEAGYTPHEVSSVFSPPRLSSGALIIDGLFGSELTKPLEGGFLALVKFFNRSGYDIISVDLPSGLFADSDALAQSSEVVHATHTLTFETPRLSMLLSECAPYIGRWQVLPLGIDETVHEGLETPYMVQTEAILNQSLQHRKIFTSKYDYGVGLLVGGQYGRFGRLALSAKAALMMGCGELEVMLPSEGEQILQTLTPEVMTLPPEMLDTSLGAYRAIGFGSGADSWLTAERFKRICQGYGHPMVLDDMALRLIGKDNNLLNYLPEDSILLISSQMRATLLGMHHSDLGYIQSATDLSTRHKLTIVLKGTYPSIVRPSGIAYFVTSGNAGMASAGMGDVLMGMILGLLTRGYEPLTACLLGCYLQGSAADLYAVRHSAEGMTASALLDSIPDSLRQLYGEG